MTSDQKKIALELLRKDAAERERRAAQRRQDHKSGIGEDMIDWAAMLEADAGALRAVIAMIEHYQPVDNSSSKTKRIEVVA